MNTKLSQAQSIQQSNRTSDGKYTFGTHAEPDGVDLPSARPASVAYLEQRYIGITESIAHLSHAKSSAGLALASESAKADYPAATHAVIGRCDDPDCDSLHLLNLKDDNDNSVVDQDLLDDPTSLEGNFPGGSAIGSLNEYDRALCDISSRTNNGEFGSHEFTFALDDAVRQERQREINHDFVARGQEMVRQHGALYEYSAQTEDADRDNLSTVIYDLAAFARSRGINAQELFAEIVEQESFEQN